MPALSRRVAFWLAPPRPQLRMERERHRPSHSRLRRQGSRASLLPHPSLRPLVADPSLTLAPMAPRLPQKSKEKLLNLYQSLSGSAYAHTLTQYFDFNGIPFRGNRPEHHHRHGGRRPAAGLPVRSAERGRGHDRRAPGMGARQLRKPVRRGDASRYAVLFRMRMRIPRMGWNPERSLPLLIYLTALAESRMGEMRTRTVGSLTGVAFARVA